MKLLLVEPEFPLAVKSRNHSHFLPIGLLKIGSYHRLRGDKVRLVRGLARCGFTPDRVLVTSLFTYWSEHVHQAVAFYHEAYPNAQIEIGGVYASLMPEDCKARSPFAIVRRGLYRGGPPRTCPSITCSCPRSWITKSFIRRAAARGVAHFVEHGELSQRLLAGARCFRLSRNGNLSSTTTTCLQIRTLTMSWRNSGTFACLMGTR